MEFLVSKSWSKITRTVKVSFFCALIVGFLSHLPIIANRLFNHDSLTYLLFDPSSTFALQQGKWLSSPIAFLLQGNIASTNIIIPIGILFIALTAALTASILKIHSNLWAAVIGAFLVLFPSVMSANTFYGSAVFFFALLLSALAVFVTVRMKHGYLPGIVLLTLSCGIYAVFIGYAAGLFVIVLLLELLENKRKISEILLSGVKFVAVLIVSAAFYYLILKIVQNASGIVLSEYRNIDRIGNISLSSLFSAVVYAYKKVLYFFIYGIFIYLNNFRIEPMFRVLNWATLMIAAICAAYFGIKTKAYQKWGRVALIAILVALFPLAIHAVGVLSQNEYTHWIMCYPFVLTFVMMVALIDRVELLQQTEQTTEQKLKRRNAFTRSAGIAVLIVSILLLRQWYMTTNQGYEFLRYADQNALSTGILLVDDIRETEDYQTEIPVAFVGTELPDAFQYITGDFSQVCGTNGDGYTGLRLPITDAEHLKILLRDYIGVAFSYADSDTISELSKDETIRQMPVYPEQGSIMVYRGYLIVKLSDIEAETVQ